MKKLWTWLPLLLITDNSFADTLDNANSFFQLAETYYPEIVSPAGMETQELVLVPGGQGYYYRYYTATDTYLATLGDDIFALGPFSAYEIIYGGKVRDYISLPDTDITETIFENHRAQCSYYADRVYSQVVDITRNLPFSGQLEISVDGDFCVFRSNSIPNHDFNDGSAWFATAVSSVDREYRVPMETYFASDPTPITLQFDNAILLNGVKVDLLAAACYGVADGRIGCNDIEQPWRLDPMSGNNEFGTDLHNAHTQPDGTYHYHGNPNALFDTTGQMESPVIGFAADGFPIFGSFINDNGVVRAVSSSYRLRAGSRPAGNGSPGGTYDGTYIDDYEFVAGSGDLDQCNGMMRTGVYGYYVTDSYPWLMACFQGTPDSSFQKSGSGGPPPPGPPPI